MEYFMYEMKCIDNINAKDASIRIKDTCKYFLRPNNKFYSSLILLSSFLYVFFKNKKP